MPPVLEHAGNVQSWDTGVDHLTGNAPQIQSL